MSFYSICLSNLFILLMFVDICKVSAAGPDSLFLSDEIIDIELSADFSAIRNERSGTPKYHEGELIYYSSGNQQTRLSVKVMARGEFRLDPAHCKFPPLLINFKKDEVKNTVFVNQDKLKLVTPCQFENDVTEEYLIYKMYNLLTDKSLKVRLVRIVYFDRGTGKNLFRRLSFFIEEKDHAASRNNSFEFSGFITPFDLDRENVKNLAVFEYMIGNKDWYITSRRNIVVMQPEDAGLKPYAVPYDFDLAGLVNPVYSRPEKLPPSVPVRVYKSICFSPEELNDAFDIFKKLRPDFESLVIKNDLIARYKRNQILLFLDSFYKIIENRELVKQEFIDVCETRKDYNLP
jgi:hypothetical protein